MAELVGNRRWRREKSWNVMVKEYLGLDDYETRSSASTAQMCAETLRAAPAGFDANTTLSVIIRFHKQERISFLDEALFSLAIQHWHDLEAVVVLQNGTDEMKTAVIDLIECQPWLAPPRYQVLSYEVAAGVDGRSSLLNHGMAKAHGRYLAFLDDDDLVYQHGYATLIRQLMAGGRAIAIGVCRTAKNEYEASHWYVKIKESPFKYGRTRLDLFRRNFVPIHSYVIDRARIGGFDLWFDDELPPVEDYDFLLRLCAAFEPDFSKLATPVCEYRFHGANSTPYDVDGTGLSTVSGPGLTKAEHSMAKVEEKKKQYTCSLSLIELAQIAESQDELECLQRERARLTYKAARVLSEFVETHTWAAKPISRLVRFSTKIIRH